MTAEEDLLDILREAECHPACNYGRDLKCTMKPALLAWHTKHRIQVSRETLEKILDEELIAQGRENTLINISRRVMAWVHREDIKIWCKHFTWRDDKGHLRGWYYTQFPDQMLIEEWDQCPVKDCHAPRP